LSQNFTSKSLCPCSTYCSVLHAYIYTLSMRFPPFAHIVRNIYLFTSASTRPAATQRTLHAAARPAVLRASMPLGGLFSWFHSSAPSREMSYPGDKGDEHWRTVLSPGTLRMPYPPILDHPCAYMLMRQ
jgi:hypothetical protein